MIYVIADHTILKGHERLRALLDRLQGESPHAPLLRFDGESLTEKAFDDARGSRGLFPGRMVVVFDSVLVNPRSRDIVLPHLEELASSENIFVFFEAAVDAKTLSRLKHYAKKIDVVSAPAYPQKRTFDSFSLTDAFGNRDRKRLWVLFWKGKRTGMAVEEIHGLLFWQAKSMLIAAGSENAADSGLNPFVFRKARGFLKHYTKEEIVRLLSQLVSLYHDARRGIHDLDVALERFILSI